jgi:hypothetical protein
MGIVYPEGTGFVAIVGGGASKLIEAGSSLALYFGVAVRAGSDGHPGDVSRFLIAGFNGWNSSED